MISAELFASCQYQEISRHYEYQSFNYKPLVISMSTNIPEKLVFSLRLSLNSGT